jgi:hypothetical protein
MDNVLFIIFNLLKFKQKIISFLSFFEDFKLIVIFYIPKNIKI